MATTQTSAVTNTYQKYFSKKLLKTAVQATIMDQFALTEGLPKNAGALIISFFRRTKSSVVASGSGAGLVAAVQALTEGVPISTFNGATMDRVDITLTQIGEATKITDILSNTQLFNALQQNIALMGEDCALNADGIIQKQLVAATNAGITLTQGGGGTVTEKISQIYSQGLASFSALNSASASGGKAVATDFLRAVTTLKLNRAPTFGGQYVAAICPQVSGDLQNDPDWIDASNYGDPTRRFKMEVKTFAGCRFVEHTNPFTENCAGTEHVFVSDGTAAAKGYRTWILGQGAYGVPALSGNTPYSPRIIIAQGADKTDPLDQFMTAGWKAFWQASAVNCPYGLSLTSKSEFSV